MIYKISRPVSILNASVKLPASKSISNRLLIIHALSGNEGLPSGLSDSDDTDVMVKALSGSDHHGGPAGEATAPSGAMKGTAGAAEDVASGSDGTPGAADSGITVHDIGHAGTSMRFLTAFFSAREGDVLLTGSPRMKQRPIGPLVDALRTLGANISYTEKEGFPPLRISGSQLEGGAIAIDGGISSQFISALLMIAPTMKRGLRLELKGEIVSASYIRMTLALMRECGVESLWSGNHIAIPRGDYRHGRYRVEADWSAASYWYAMGFLENGGRVALGGLKEDSLQGDSALVELFGRLGMQTVFSGEKVVLESVKGSEQDEKLEGPGRLKVSQQLDRQQEKLSDGAGQQEGFQQACGQQEESGLQQSDEPGAGKKDKAEGAGKNDGLQSEEMFEYDFTNCPDIVQSMAVALCLKGIPFRFSGTQTLKIKETDRIVALQAEMRKLGYVLESDGAGAWLSWNRKMCTPDSDPVIATYHDHRMAMAFAPVALVRGGILIEDPGVVTKSYPDFWKDLERAGFTISS
jgi:3-phosphoshikimate 1-carboxyvinyltransferase